MVRHLDFVQHEHDSRQHHGVELAESPRLPTRGLDGPHPDLAHVVQHVLLQEVRVFHESLIVCEKGQS